MKVSRLWIFFSVDLGTILFLDVKEICSSAGDPLCRIIWLCAFSWSQLHTAFSVRFGELPLQHLRSKLSGTNDLPYTLCVLNDWPSCFLPLMGIVESIWLVKAHNSCVHIFDQKLVFDRIFSRLSLVIMRNQINHYKKVLEKCILLLLARKNQIDRTGNLFIRPWSEGDCSYWRLITREKGGSYDFDFPKSEISDLWRWYQK